MPRRLKGGQQQAPKLQCLGPRHMSPYLVDSAMYRTRLVLEGPQFPSPSLATAPTLCTHPTLKIAFPKSSFFLLNGAFCWLSATVRGEGFFTQKGGVRDDAVALIGSERAWWRLH